MATLTLGGKTVLTQTGSVEPLVPAVVHLKNRPSRGTAEGLLISPTL